MPRISLVFTLACLLWQSYSQESDDTLDLDEDTVYSDTGVPETIYNEQQDEQQLDGPPDLLIDERAYLSTLSVDQLVQICVERGYTVDLDADLMDQALFCLQQDDTYANQVIANDPDIAADLQLEVERMRVERERLLEERDVLVMQVEQLARQLEGSEQAALQEKVQNVKKVGEPETTFVAVLKESLIQLRDRIHQDWKLLCRLVLRPAAKTTLVAVRVLHQTVGPLLNTVWKVTLGPLVGPRVAPYVQPLISLGVWRRIRTGIVQWIEHEG